MTTNDVFSMDTTHGPLVLAHRGWSAAFPENTLTACREALTAGADGLEFDVQLTADDVIVVIHDADLPRTTDGTGMIRELHYAQIQLFNAAARWSSLPAEPVPTLQSVLDAANESKPDGLYNVEIKVHEGDDWAKLVDAVLKLVDRHPLKSRILFSSFHHDAVTYLKQRSPEAHVGLLFDGDVPDAWQKAAELGAYSVNMDYRVVTAEFVTACHQNGIKVAVWTVNEPADLERIAGTGTDVIITNRVDTGLETVRK